jgi:uncharacterized protein (DUF885 family)
METTYIPAAPREPGIWTMPDGAAYYQFLIRRTTTTSLSADAIHQLGVEEVSKDEAEMLCKCFMESLHGTVCDLVIESLVANARSELGCMLKSVVPVILKDRIHRLAARLNRRNRGRL